MFELCYCISFHHLNVFVENFTSYVTLYLHVCWCHGLRLTDLNKETTYLLTYLVTGSYFQSHNKDGGHAIRSAKNPTLHAHFTAVRVIDAELLAMKFSTCRDRDLCWHTRICCENTGWLSTFLLLWPFIAVCRATLLSTSWTAASLRLMLPCSRQRLRSASRHQLIVPRHRCTKFGRRAFSVAGPTAWNSLPDYLRDPSLSKDTFRRLLKTYLFALY